MWEKTYYIDITTILTLMAIGATLGFMLGRRFMQVKMLILFTIVFLVATFIFLDNSQPDLEEKIVRKETLVEEAPKIATPEPEESVNDELKPVPTKDKVITQSGTE